MRIERRGQYITITLPREGVESLKGLLEELYGINPWIADASRVVVIGNEFYLNYADSPAAEQAEQWLKERVE